MISFKFAPEPETSTLSKTWERLAPIAIVRETLEPGIVPPVIRAYIVRTPGPRASAGTIKHGTLAGYRTEVARKIPRCPDCKRANAEYVASRRAER